MPITPGGSIITIGGSSLRVDEVKTSYENEFFDRQEFSNDRLLKAPNADGSTPVFLPLYGGRVVQLAVNCGAAQAARSILPDDANVDLIKRRLNIKRYTMRGGPSLLASVDAVYATAQLHVIRWARFQAHLAKAQMNLSYTALIAMQAETFSYLTSTSFGISGASVTTETNMLIRQWSPDVEVEYNGTVLKGWTAVLDVITISSAFAV